MKQDFLERQNAHNFCVFEDRGILDMRVDICVNL